MVFILPEELNTLTPSSPLARLLNLCHEVYLSVPKSRPGQSLLSSLLSFCSQIICCATMTRPYNVSELCLDFKDYRSSPKGQTVQQPQFICDVIIHHRGPSITRMSFCTNLHLT